MEYISLIFVLLLNWQTSQANTLVESKADSFYNMSKSSLPEDITNCESRLNKLETQLELMQRNQNKILEQLERMESKLNVGTTTKFPPNNNNNNIIPEKFQKVGCNHYYVEESYKTNWFGADHFCRQMNSHLVNLQNEMELNALLDILPEKQLYWLDLHDLINKFDFRSQTTGKTAYTKWAPGEPNNFFTEDCVELATARNKRNMNDRPCLDKRLFICEIKGERKDDCLANL